MLKSCKSTFEGTIENLHQFLLDYTRLYKVYFRLFKFLEQGSKVSENIKVLIIISSSSPCFQTVDSIEIVERKKHVKS